MESRLLTADAKQMNHTQERHTQQTVPPDSNPKEKRGFLSGLFSRSPKPERSSHVQGTTTHKGDLLNPTKPSDTVASAAVNSVQTQVDGMVLSASETSPPNHEQDNDNLLDWWGTVEGWEEWNKRSNFKEEDLAVEQAADRVYMAARLFVRLFNKRGESLQQRILDLLGIADAADNFHKRTVVASVGGGAASMAGSVATITGLVLAPFTFGASVIVTAVGIGVATAGGVASASASITDTLHSNTDRKKVETIIQGYQEDMKDIKECLEFVQEGMDVLQRWNFDSYTESLAKQPLEQNVKHVVKEGARAGKALMVNTEKLVSTVQVLSVAGGAARAAQVVTGVMSALFLALDVFFLAKDSHELRKGAKTKFALRIREVCKELQQGLLELNRVKTSLQKIMDGIELPEEEEVDPAQLEMEMDQLEGRLDQTKLEKKESGPTPKGVMSGEEKVESSLNTSSRPRAMAISQHNTEGASSQPAPI